MSVGANAGAIAGAGAGNGGQAAKVIPFRAVAARHRKSSVYTIPWQTGQRTGFGLNNVGYLTALEIELALTITIVTGTVTDAIQAARNFLPFIGLRSPQGEYIWSTNSRDLLGFSTRLWPHYSPLSEPDNVAPNYGASSAQPIHLRIPILVSANDGMNFDFGALMRQISNNQFYLELQMAQQSDLVGAGSATISSITGQVIVKETWYDAVQDGANVNGVPVQPPSFKNYLRLRTQQAPNNLQNGQNIVRYDTGPVLCDALFRIINNGVGDGTLSDLAYIQLQANTGNEIDNRSGADIAADNYRHLGASTFAAGEYLEDFFDDYDEINVTKGRDLINSNLASQLQFNIQYAGSPTGTNGISVFYREIVGIAA